MQRFSYFVAIQKLIILSTSNFIKYTYNFQNILTPFELFIEV